MILKKNSLNKILINLLYNKKLSLSDNFYKIRFIKRKILNRLKRKFFYNIYFNKNHIYNIFLCNSLKNILFRNKKFKLINKDKDIVKKITLYINKTSLTLKSNKTYQYKLITCIGSGKKWIGIGESKNKLFKKAYSKSVNTAKKNIYNFNFQCNDYKYLKYKGCKFKALNMRENKHNLKTYEDIFYVSGNKKIKLLSYSSKTPINVIKSFLNFF